MLQRPEIYFLIPPIPTESEGFFQENPAHPHSPAVRMNQEPSQLGFLRGSPDNGNRTCRHRLPFKNPQTALVGPKGKGKLGQSGSDVRLKGMVIPVFFIVKDAVKPGNRTNVSGAKIPSELHIARQGLG